MFEVYPSFSCFINSLQGRHGTDPAPLSLFLSLLCFAVVTAVTRRRAKACWDRTEEIWWVWNARLGSCSKPWTDGGVPGQSGISYAPSIGLLCAAACPPRWPLNFMGSPHPTSPMLPAPSVFPLHFLALKHLTVFGGCWVEHGCLSICASVCLCACTLMCVCVCVCVCRERQTDSGGVYLYTADWLIDVRQNRDTCTNKQNQTDAHPETLPDRQTNTDRQTDRQTGIHTEQ